MEYTKMHGAGNGFVLLDNTEAVLPPDEYDPLAIQLCSLENMDGMILITKAEDADCGMLFFNRDGSAGEMCGNGARCLARYAVEHGLASDPQHIRIRATAGIVPARRIDPERYEIRLNDPSVIDLHRTVTVDEDSYDCFYTELGNPGIPHAVLFLSDPFPGDLSSIRALGRSLRSAEAFPRGANVTFLRQTGDSSAEALTYERGVEDFTLACGTGCGASAAAMVLLGRTSSHTVQISMPGGLLSVSLRKKDSTVSDLFLTGPTAIVGTGTI
jgi:diaminopimelate epimerase